MKTIYRISLILFLIISISACSLFTSEKKETELISNNIDKADIIEDGKTWEYVKPISLEVDIKNPIGSLSEIRAVIDGDYGGDCNLKEYIHLDEQTKTWTINIYADWDSDGPTRTCVDAAIVDFSGPKRFLLEGYGLKQGEYTVIAGNKTTTFTLEQDNPTYEEVLGELRQELDQREWIKVEEIKIERVDTDPPSYDAWVSGLTLNSCVELASITPKNDQGQTTFDFTYEIDTNSNVWGVDGFHCRWWDKTGSEFRERVTLETKDLADGRHTVSYGAVTTTFEIITAPEVIGAGEGGADYFFVLKSFGGSCGTYELQNNNREVIELPKEIETYLSCPSQLPIFDPEYKAFYFKWISPLPAAQAYEDWWYHEDVKLVLKRFDLETGEITELMTFFDDTENAVLYDWSPNGKKLIMVVINLYRPTEYPNQTKIMALNIEDGKIIHKQKYNITLHLNCSANGPCVPLPDLKWVDDTSIEYTDYACEGALCFEENSEMVRKTLDIVE